MKSPIRWGLLALQFLLALGLTGPALAESTADSKTVDNLVIYLGVLPAEMIRGHPVQHPGASMHGGRPAESNEYHVTIALFDAKTGARITNAKISARVSEIGLAGEEKKLTPMQIADTVTYGNYFQMAGNGPFRVRLVIHIPDQPREIRAEFEHWHR